ncbi:hypothetical protein A9Q87_04580 [Flavobacteriales bacterium 34_180_T64]|nr:hypothetical protein A9Q87_04580 [Flavobacteriales bacterium 34_180_T64]
MYKYTLDPHINLHVKEHISESDAKRQMVTAKEIFRKLEKYPGLVLADEVGMGKTFVALAVAVSIAIENKDQLPVVIMIPTNLSKKWPRDFQRFKDFCLPANLSDNIQYGVAKNAVQFLKYLDDPIERRKQIIFLTHGSLTRSLTDGWVKLAIIQRAMYRRHNMGETKKALKKILSNLLYLGFAEKIDPDIWDKLLVADAKKWLKILLKSGIDPENDNNASTDDDPIPEAIYDALYNKMDTHQFNEVLEAINQVPKRKSKYMDQRIREVRNLLNKKAKDVWNICSQNIPYQLPLLILDEAHHLKNARTRLASLFSTAESKDDTIAISEGQLAGVFDRMLFLTATPFQLGHHELCEVLKRFKGINWNGEKSPTGGIKKYTKSLEQLRKSLDDSQIQSTRLDQVWGQMKDIDRFVDGQYYIDENTWWEELMKTENLTLGQNNAIKAIERCQIVMSQTEKDLRKYVIRHIKDREFEYRGETIKRRLRWRGDQILKELEYPDELENSGLSIDGPALLPFLLAARHSIREREKRPVFAEGLASSYEAFMRTRNADLSELLDHDDDAVESINYQDDWHVNNLFKYVADGMNNHNSHPKINATIQRVMDLWENGEKVLVFCHYVQTGKALRAYISKAMNSRILQIGAKKLGIRKAEVAEQLDKIGQRFYKENNLREVFDERLNAILIEYPEISKTQWKTISDAIYRYLRTPSFLVRYFPIGQKKFNEDTMRRALRAKGSTGESLEEMITRFVHFQAKQCNENDRQEFLDALDRVQSGYIGGEDSEEERIRLVPNVRLVNGATKQDARQTLMLTFNTPFFPEVLIASSVMAEGVDLHLNCRYVIHHDLCWNPSTLEQRTGRVDRIGSKGEKLGKSVNVYLPFISETQDEKMYRVVMDRERWFKVVMGEKFKTDVMNADQMSERIPLPLSIVNNLTFNLRVYKGINH